MKKSCGQLKQDRYEEDIVIIPYLFAFICMISSDFGAILWQHAYICMCSSFEYQ